MRTLRSIWHDGGTAIGAWLLLREPLLAEEASRAGYDWVCIDLQHGLVGFEHVDAMLAAASLGSASPLVRVPWNDTWMINRVLDAGAAGVIVPMVNTAEEAARAVAACRYAPVGVRSIGPTAAAVRHGAGYVEAANDDVLCIVMVETAHAVRNIDAIVAVPGVDAVYIGPSDLSLSLGVEPRMDQSAPEFLDALAAVSRACARAGVVAGVHADASLVAIRHAAGFRMINAGFDHRPVTLALHADLATARAAAAR